MSTLQLKRGTKANLPASAAAGEPVWATDTRELFIGTGSGLVAVLPSGMIIMWSGTLANIPVGWVLCDGNNGTPDLRSKFIKGSAAGINPGVTGGAASASYTPAGTNSGGAVNAHTTASTKDASSGSATTKVTGPASHTFTQPTFAGTPATIPTEPPYYSLAFLMKV